MVVAVVIVINSVSLSMSGYFNCPIKSVQLEPTVRLELYRIISEKQSS